MGYLFVKLAELVGQTPEAQIAIIVGGLAVLLLMAKR